MYKETSRPEVHLYVNGGLLWVRDDLDDWGGWPAVTVVGDGTLQVGYGGSLPRDGTVVKERNHFEVWVIRNRQKCWISNPDQVDWAIVRAVPANSLEFFSQGPDEPIVFKQGHMYKEVCRPEVYLYVNGGLLWIRDDPNNWGGWDKVAVVGCRDLHVPQVGSLPNDGTMLKEKDNNQVWLVRNRQKCWIHTGEQIDANGGWAAVRIVPDASLDFFSQGPDIW